MKFNCTAGGLLTALKFGKRTTTRGPRDTWLTSGFLVIAGPTTVTLISTDLQTELTGTISAEILAMGSGVLPAKLADLCAALPSDAVVSVAMENDVAIVKSGRSRYKLNVFSATEFPRSVAALDALEIAVDVADLRDAMAAVAHAMADNDVRYYLNGMCIAIADGVMQLAATNGHRLALQSIPCGQGVRRVILPRKACAVLRAALDSLDIGDGATIVLSFLERALYCEASGWSIHAKLIDGTFPQWDRVMPEVQSSIQFSRADLLGAIKRIGAIGHDNASVRVMIDGDATRLK